MFPLKATDELVFGISLNTTTSSISFTTPDSESSLLLNHVMNTTAHTDQSSTISFSCNNSTGKARTNRRARGEEVETKKASHRDIERQRRQEMAQLYASLRSLLPLDDHDHIKGKHKHSISDIMHESKNYIEKVQNKVQELGARRDKLKKISIPSSSEFVVSSSDKVNKVNSVEVNRVQDGIEILISCNSKYMLSGVMIELMDCELNVVNCVSTKIDERFLHKIQIEAAGDERLVDLLRLQERLTNMIKKDDSTKDSQNM